MKRIVSSLLLIFALSDAGSQHSTRQSVESSPLTKPGILLYSATKGFRHSSIPDGIEAIQKMAVVHNWKITATEDSLYFSTHDLQQFSAIILLNTTGNIFDSSSERALQQYIRSGGGLAGVHAATDCEYNWPWYNQLIGAYFESHPAIQTATIRVKEKHPSTAHLEGTWVRKDEWYNFKNLSPTVKVLLELDETTYKGGKMGTSHPVGWYQEFEGGKVFYTALGHTKESYTEPAFLKHLEGGILSVMRK
ncbi:ThuA domain-containing protein [Flavihumibacter stibioxidans]|uniref:Crp/Fnr family transcriptional regulator n=1 Tax=Flavihumibacter stibioxidans TaxID=1834163 RepID=A0ABR7M4W0_9BACT|nr:ThuA domain-containing protein [Flavihumibacter stibioxidans]MBC6490055.1 Crp/Fnr family transcriptional regulator [Flavihumibacter stibioxidans]